MTTVNEWVETAREYLGTGVVEPVNRLAADFTPGGTTLTVQYPLQGVTQGTPICVGLACFLAWTTSDPQITVSEGWAGAASVACTSGDIVRIRPQYYTHRIFNAINETLVELSSPLNGVYGVSTLDVVWESSQTAYDLTGATGIQKILRVQFGDDLDAWETWPELGVDEWAFRSISPNTQFPSGKQLTVYSDRIPADATMRVTYGRTLGTVTALTDDATVTALPVTAYDLPALGAASRLAMPAEFRRNRTDAQGDTRRPTEVPAGAVLGGARALRAMFKQRVEDEAARLMALYPPKQR